MFRVINIGLFVNWLASVVPVGKIHVTNKVLITSVLPTTAHPNSQSAFE